MPGDYTRKTFDPRKHYVGVLMQQGRVQLDADWNEEQSIRQHRDETEARDIIGGCGAPLFGGGFSITPTNDASDLVVSPGRFYVDGILCELEVLPVQASLVAEISNQVQLESIYVDGYPLAPGHWIELFENQGSLLSPPGTGALLRVDEVDEENARITIEGDLPDFSSPASDLRLRRVITFLTQPDFPNPGIDGVAGSPPVTITSPPGDLNLPVGLYLAYLDVWQRELTALDDPLIREVALGGPDTATRLKTTCQVRLLAVAASSPADATCATPFPEWGELIIPSSGRLNARTRAPSPEEDPCQLPPSAGYRLLENQLYRVEIQDAGNRAQATFKWSRDNASVETRIVEIDPTDGTRVEVSTVGKDDVLGFQPGQWVEIVDDEAELKGNPHPLVLIDEVSPGENLIILNTDISAHRGTARKLRRWDQTASINANGVVSLTAGDAEGWLDLEGGIQVQFADGTYRSGDFWLIPARTVTGEIEWPPFETPNMHPIPQSPYGIQHHYCRLALIEVAADASISVHDCRCRFPSLSQIQALNYISGDGQEVMPALPSTVNAVVTLPQPLVVGIVNPQCREYPATVRFTITKGSGQLRSADGTSSGIQIDLPANEDGIVECLWDLGADLTSDARREQNLPSQQVEARLLDENDETIHLPLRFNANLSVAEQVAYDPQGCPNLAGDNTVQSAIGKLTEILTIAHHAGDGQVAAPGVSLPHRVEVRVFNLCGELPEGLQVEFTPQAGGFVSKTGPVSGALTSLVVDVEADGIAGCFWLLNPNSSLASQQLKATLLDSPEHTLQGPEFVIITGNHSLAATDPGIHVQKLRLIAGPDLINDTDVTANQLAEGIQILCEKNVVIDPVTVREKPTCFVTLELPYPFNAADRELWSPSGAIAPVIAYQPLILHADLNASKNVISWRPVKDTQTWLVQQLFQAMAKLERGDRILARLTLQGNFIWAAKNPDVFLDGEVFGIRTAATIGLRLPSGNGARGGTLEMWFWLVRQLQPEIHLVNGWNLIAYQLDKGKNTLPEIFADVAVPDGMQFAKFSTGGFAISVFDSPEGKWTDPAQTLKPGEGAFVFNPTDSTVVVPMTGNRHSPTQISLNPGFNLVSSQTVGTASYEDIVGQPPIEGTQVFRFSNSEGTLPPLPSAGAGYTIHEFALGEWSPSEPVLRVGESAFIVNPGSSPPRVRAKVVPPKRAARTKRRRKTPSRDAD